MLLWPNSFAKIQDWEKLRFSEEVTKIWINLLHSFVIAYAGWFFCKRNYLNPSIFPLARETDTQSWAILLNFNSWTSKLTFITKKSHLTPGNLAKLVFGQFYHKIMEVFFKIAQLFLSIFKRIETIIFTEKSDQKLYLFRKYSVQCIELKGSGVISLV